MNLLDNGNFDLLFVEKLEVTCGVSVEDAAPENCYTALAHLIKDQIMKKWVQDNPRIDKNGRKKKMYYFSIEFLLGRMLESNILSLGLREICETTLRNHGFDPEQVYGVELDPGLGNGGLGRLAACFMDSCAFLGLPGNGNSIRYKYGLFEQKIVDGYQVELPDNWLQDEVVWEVKKPNDAKTIKFYGTIHEERRGDRLYIHHENYEPVVAMPYDVPIPGGKDGVVNTLRLWSAESTQQFNYSSFSSGDYINAVSQKYSAEAISEVLYPDDSNYQNRMLRLKQQYFFVSAGIQSIIDNYKQCFGDIHKLDEYIAIHINDTHPALAVPELMRVLMDDEGLSWDEAWEITVKTISYTNHTILPEALEKWPEDSFRHLFPRIYMIVGEINRRFINMLREKFGSDTPKASDLAIISNGQISMAYLAVVGSHSINGVAQVHSELLKNVLFHGFYELYPERFNNKTNGITHRRWIQKANPSLTALITEAIGSEWLKRPCELQKLDETGAIRDSAFLERLRAIKRDNKLKLARIIRESNGVIVDPDSIFDVQIKRIHAYKRQLLLLLYIIDLYYALLDNPKLSIVPRTFIMAGKAAPSYHFAKEIIKLISVVSNLVDKAPRVKSLVNVIFLENYRVSLAERIFPASDLSEQISTASMEASGTGNMKFMLNGALTIGTHDGANIEIFEAVGEGNYIPFGLIVPEVLELWRNNSYNSRDFLYGHKKLHRIVTSIINSMPQEAGRAEFPNIYDSLTEGNDAFFVMKDFDAYCDAQKKADTLYRDSVNWSKMSAMNIAHAGIFSSDEVILKYADEIWDMV